MRLFEMLLVVASLLALFATLPVKNPRPRLLLGLWIGSVLLAALQALVEKSRWQLGLVYVVLGLLAIPTFLTWRKRHEETSSAKRRGWPRIVAVVLGTLGILVSGLLAALLPVFSLPSPTGPHPVGVTSYEWVDLERTDEHLKTPSGHRRLVVKIWYPAAPSDAPHELYLDKSHAEGIARDFKLPGFVLSHLALVRTNARRDVALASGNEKFPVVLFSHGYAMTPEVYAFAVEQLASHGYVVVSISHTYDGAYVVFRDGTHASFEPAGDMKRMDTMLKAIEPRLSVWMADATFVLNQVTKLNTSEERFKGRLDLEHVGYAGHSFGGATAYAVHAVDPRFKAALNMDGALFGSPEQARPTQPFMLMNADYQSLTDEDLARVGNTRKEFDAYFGQVESHWAASTEPTKGPRYRVQIAGTPHGSFSDLPSCVPAIFSGPLPTLEVYRLINQYSLAFFDQYLKGQSSPVLVGPAADSAVKFTSHPAAPNP
jgi:predicted dienelactone hydrolase